MQVRERDEEIMVNVTYKKRNLQREEVGVMLHRCCLSYRALGVALFRWVTAVPGMPEVESETYSMETRKSPRSADGLAHLGVTTGGRVRRWLGVIGGVVELQDRPMAVAVFLVALMVRFGGPAPNRSLGMRKF